MSVDVKRVPNEAIIIGTLSGKITVDDVLEMWRLSVPLVDEIGEHTYRITDASNVEVSFTDAMMVMAKATEGAPATATDPRISVVLVGSDKWVKMVANGLNQDQYGNIKIPLFGSLDDALVFVRERLAERKRAESAAPPTHERR